VTSITTRLARDEALQAFLDAVRALDPVDGLVLLHHGFEEFTQAETATRLGLSPEMVKKRWQRLCSKICAGGIGHQLLLPRE
jgi:DNA-directed RNA polymerase specialized sigma24 family protein